jgi:hypothetical protein
MAAILLRGSLKIYKTKRLDDLSNLEYQDLVPLLHVLAISISRATVDDLEKIG